MLKKQALAAVAAAVLATNVTATASAGAATGPATVKAPPCTAHQVGKQWACITPGAYCPAAAKNMYGYPVKSKLRYRCTLYPDRHLRWKRG